MRPNATIAVIDLAVSGQDDDGNDVYAETAALTPGVWAPGGSSELVQGQDTVIYKPTAYLPAEAAVAPTSLLIPQPVVDSAGRLVLDGDGKAQGDRYKVDGQPEDWSGLSPSGWVPDFPVVVQLERVTG